ncbi:hypothetical protein ACFVTC_37280 [Streptomyces sp. NPDC057950]|uniref:hypothetical protein n=1 Tax=Streptomyces sp. NPDC057950 TaxID=3346288 RepID=UPI0036E5A8AC
MIEREAPLRAAVVVGRVYDDPIQQAAQEGSFGFSEVAEELARGLVDAFEVGGAGGGGLDDVAAPVGWIAPSLGEARASPPRSGSRRVAGDRDSLRS